MKEFGEGFFLESLEDEYHPMSELLARRDARIKIAPWDQLDLDSLTEPKIAHVDARQVRPIEQILGLYHDGITPKNSEYQLYPIDNYKRGMLGGVEVHSGSLELDMEEEFSPVTTMFFQYEHNPREKYEQQDDHDIYNDGVANVFLQSDGRIQGVVMLPDTNSEPLFFPFVPEGIRQREHPYPQSVAEAEVQIKDTYKYINARHLPLMSKLGRMVVAASDIWLNRETDYGPTETLMKIPGDIISHHIGKEGMDGHSANFFGAPIDESPLAGLVNKSLIPANFEVIEMEQYEGFLKNAIQSGYKLPSFFRSHEMGVYFSETSPFDDEMPGSHMKEILGYNGITDISRGLIVPSQFPDNYKGEWSKPLAYLKHQMVLATYEDLPEGVRSNMIERTNDLVEQSVHLRNHASQFTEIPALDASSPYAFKNYSRQQQERILGGFIAGIMTMNKDLYPYWAGPPLHGEGTSRLDWVPEGMTDLLEENGFYVSHAPSSIIHPLYIRGENRDGTPDRAERPFANPDLKFDDFGTIFTSKN